MLFSEPHIPKLLLVRERASLSVSHCFIFALRLICSHEHDIHVTRRGSFLTFRISYVIGESDRYKSRVRVIQPTVAFPLAFDHVSLDQHKSSRIRLEEGRSGRPGHTALWAMNIELIKNRLTKTLILSGAILALRSKLRRSRNIPGKATTVHPDKPDGAHTIIVTGGTAPDGGIGTTSSGSMPPIPNGP